MHALPLLPAPAACSGMGHPPSLTAMQVLVQLGSYRPRLAVPVDAM